MTDNQTRPIGEQIRFLSSRTGAWVLDTYLEMAELGNRTIADLLADLFDSNGNLIISGLSNWLGFWQTGQDYRPGDTFKNANETAVYVTLLLHTSTSIAADLASGYIDEVVVSVVGPAGPSGPAGPQGPQGPAGQTIKVIGSFGLTKVPTDLPPSGLVPINWDGAGHPPSAHQFLVGEGMSYQPTNHSDPLYGHLYSYVGTSITAAGWTDLGSASGPPGLQGPPGGSYVVVAHLNTAPPDVNNPPIVPPMGLLVIDLDDNSHGQASLPSGGTTGQHLVKASNTSYDTIWQTDDTIPEAPSDGKNYGRKSGAWSEALGITGGTLTGNLIVSGSITTQLFASITGAAGTQRALYGMTTGSGGRWAVSLGNTNAESGGNLGSDFSIYRYTDAGAFIGEAMGISRQTGAAAFSGQVAATGKITSSTSLNAPSVVVDGPAAASRPLFFDTLGSIRWAIYATGGTESGGNVSSDLSIERHTDVGGFIDVPLTISRQYGGMTLNVAADANALNFPQLNGAAGIYRLWLFRTAGSTRFSQGITSLAESGGNAGSDYVIARYTDAGALNDFPLKITRATGVVTLADGLTVTAGATTIGGTLGVTGATTTANITATGTITASGAVSSNLAVNINAPTGTSAWFLASVAAVRAWTFGCNQGDGSFTIFDSTAAATRMTISSIGTVNILNALGVTGAATLSSTLGVTGGAVFSSQITMNGASPNFVMNAPAAGQFRTFQGLTAGSTRWLMAIGNSTAEGGSNAGSDFQISAYSDAAALLNTPITIKRSTGVCTFAVAIVNGPSDRTLKENIEPLVGSLDKVLELQGVSFDLIDDPEHRRQIGLIAQDVLPVVPEVIQKYQPADTEDLKMSIDYPKLVALLIEAVKELTARVAVLEGS